MTSPTPAPEATFSERTAPADGTYIPPEFTPEPVAPLPPVGPQADDREPEPAAQAAGTGLFVRNADGSFTQVGNVSDDSPAVMPTWNHYVHTADGSVLKVLDPPTGPRHLDEETGISHQVIGVYPR